MEWGGLLGEEIPRGHAVVKVVVEVVAPGTQRGQSHLDGLPRRERHFTVELETLEFDRFATRIDDLDYERTVGWHGERPRRELVAVEADLKRGSWRSRRGGETGTEHQRTGTEKHATSEAGGEEHGSIPLMM